MWIESIRRQYDRFRRACASDLYRPQPSPRGHGADYIKFME